ncbi:MAG: AAA family ATPase [Deltaproteobacteria bacterium]|nr:AAA family ATPase [Deltaproteobacteria bacterium]
MIIGLTGKNASGKGEVAQVLQEGGFYYLSLSDMLRETAKERGLEQTRDNLIKLGRELREAHGGGCLALKALEKIEVDKNYIVDSIRNPREVEVLRQRPNFNLVNVVSEASLRFERMKARARPGDPKNYDDFLKLENQEAVSTNPHAQQMEATASLADVNLENNGSLEDLKESVKELIRALSKKKARPSWDEYFLNIARVVALRSNCMKRKVAAVIVRDKRIISTGYNGTPRGVTNCNEGGCPRCNAFVKSGENLGECYCSHAEENAIVQAAYHGVSLKDSTIYTTFSPCLICTKMILNSGIKEVVYNEAYPLAGEALGLLKEAGVGLKKVVF